MELGATRAEQPHLVSLVLQSKKALQHGEQLCSKANALTNASAQCAVDVLALDAKVKWISEAVIEQLKVRRLFKYLFLFTLYFHAAGCHCGKEHQVQTRATRQADSRTSSSHTRHMDAASPRVSSLSANGRNGTLSVRSIPLLSMPSLIPLAHSLFLQAFINPRRTLLFSGANIRLTR